MAIGGISDVASVLSVSTQRAHQLTQMVSFPDPVAELSTGRVWEIDDVERWQQLRTRQPKGSRPSTLGERFLVDEFIGEGGFAKVYRADDLANPDQVVAVKLLINPERDEDLRRFGREMALMKAIEHPNVIPVLETGIDSDGHPWYAMPLAQGSLEDELPNLAGDVEAIANTMRDVASGLAHLHGQDPAVFHRDLCPKNILRAPTGRWAISDFGLARLAERRSGATRSSVFFGQFLYMAPEQMQGLKHAQSLADVFSLGKVLWAMVIGRDPLPGEPVPVDSTFRAVIRKATEMEQDRRYQGVEEMLADLETLVEAPSHWAPGEEQESQLESLRYAISDIPQNLPALQTLRAIVEETDSGTSTMGTASEVMAYMDDEDIRLLWDDSPARFRAMIAKWSTEVAQRGYDFAFCDNLANFGVRAAGVTADEEVLTGVIGGLACLGETHNRWHVRSRMTSLVQNVRDRDVALAVLDALRTAGRSSVVWNFSSFVVRSLHPVLRHGIEEMLADG